MWYRIPSIRTTSNVPTVSGDRSSTSISWSSTFESSARRARSNPSLVPSRRRPNRRSRSRGRVRRRGVRPRTRRTCPTRRASSTVLPERSSGRRIFGRRSELSSTPGVNDAVPERNRVVPVDLRDLGLKLLGLPRSTPEQMFRPPMTPQVARAGPEPTTDRIMSPSSACPRPSRPSHTARRFRWSVHPGDRAAPRRAPRRSLVDRSRSHARPLGASRALPRGIPVV